MSPLPFPPIEIGSKNPCAISVLIALVMVLPTGGGSSPVLKNSTMATCGIVMLLPFIGSQVLFTGSFLLRRFLYCRRCHTNKTRSVSVLVRVRKASLWMSSATMNVPFSYPLHPRLGWVRFDTRSRSSAISFRRAHSPGVDKRLHCFGAIHNFGADLDIRQRVTSRRPPHRQNTGGCAHHRCGLFRGYEMVYCCCLGVLF